MSFCAVRETPLTRESSLVSFDTVTVNDGNAFNLTSSKLTAPRNGLYWLHMSVGLESETSVKIQLNGEKR